MLFALGATLPADSPAETGTDRGAAGRVKTGTGFFVSPDGFIATSAHVIAGCQNISIWQADGIERRSYIIAADRKRDLALLWADGSASHPSAGIAPEMPPPGGAVFTLGFGTVATQPLLPVVVTGSIVGPGTAQAGNRVLVIRARLHAGNSGGALLAENGSLLGMIVGRDDENKEFGIAIPRDDIEALLAAYRIRLPNHNVATDPRSALTTISVLIQCARPDNS